MEKEGEERQAFRGEVSTLENRKDFSKKMAFEQRPGKSVEPATWLSQGSGSEGRRQWQPQLPEAQIEGRLRVRKLWWQTAEGHRVCDSHL